MTETETETVVRGTAIISDDQRYRYVLSRQWAGDNTSPYVLWVMLNPSTADAAVDDPTIRRCISFSQEWGFDRLCVVNLFALRSPKPEVLSTVPLAEAVGPDNDMHIKLMSEGAALAVCAWGAQKIAKRRAPEVKALLDYPMCLELTKDGHPKHPLYVKGATRPRLLP